ncbi:Rab-like protein 6 [Taenia crassiceps]|uniref:Rab-like protein 6 n=1 Tax=Taenia crassiceps TaxID=6207 RepID=A0ABR4QFA3_9CEST
MSILKKIFSRDSPSNGNLSTNGGFCHLKPELREKLSCGVKYNLKLVIRGDRKSGKSALLSRLKGEAFDPSYTPTDEIKVANILWNYQPTNDAVKVDVWDVVDKGRQREVKHGAAASGYISKLTKKSQTATAMASLDSTFINVYKGVNCVILMFDMTREWTFEYVCRELPKVPHSVPVLVVGNFRDAVAAGEADRAITETEVRTFIGRMLKVRQSSTFGGDVPEFCRQCAPIRYCETSMKNGFGLMYIHRFLNIPFLHLQCAYLLQALAVNRQAFSSISQQLDLAEENGETICSYEKFTRWLESVRGPAVRVGLERETLQPDLVTTTTGRVDASPKKQAFPVKPNKVSINEPSLPTSVAEDSAFREFIQNVDNSPTLVSPSTNGLNLNVDPVESSSNSAPAVAAFQEDIDPDDAVVGSVVGGFNGVVGSLRPLVDSVDDDLVDEDDDDLMNEDDDDDEEQLGPALGLAAFSNEAVDDGQASTKARDGLQSDRLPTFQSSSPSSSSPSSSPSASPHPPNTVPSVLGAPLHDPSADLVTLEELNAFERFLDDI